MSNVVLLMSDEHNPFVSTVYGHKYVQTPNMAALAKQGTVFRNAYCPSPLCLPSRSAFMAGKRVHEIQTYNNCNVNLHGEYPSYGEVLDRQGVYTVYIGKTDVYNTGQNLGFSEMIMEGDRPLPGDINFAREPLTIRKDAHERANNFGPQEKPTKFKNDAEKVDAAIEWLTTKAPNLDQPWVVIVNINNPHFPHWTTQELWDMYPEGEDLPKYGIECDSANHPYAKDLRDHFQADLFTEEQVRGLRRGYLGCVTFVDQQLGRIMNALKKNGQLDNTNIIYTSDHGDMLGKFGMWWKCSLYEDSVRIPCIAAGPDFEAGKTVETPVDLLDVQAAIFKAVGAKRCEDWKGIPLQEIPQNDKDRVVFSEYHGHGTRSGAYMIRKGDWKLIYYMKASHQLFNLADDPEELNNLYEVYPKKAEELEKELRQICSPEVENERAHCFEKAQLEVIKRLQRK